MKIRRRILFHFHGRINVISTLIHNVETAMIRRWNVGWENSKRNNSIMYGLWRIFQLRKRRKLKEVSDFTIKPGGCFYTISKFLKKLSKNYSKFVWLAGKIINVIRSFSFQSYEIIIHYRFKAGKVTSKQCSSTILISLVFQIIVFKVIHTGERKVSRNFLLNLFI